MSYTNIAIMGTYVTYMVSNLFELPELKNYSADRLNRFYNYTLDKEGFSEYNSPTYTIIALNELYRMKSHIVEPVAKQNGSLLIKKELHNLRNQHSISNGFI